jgi:threonine/homoserine/homoserine lactone efflux protein
VAGARSRRVLAAGFIVGVSNPKSIVFFGLVLPQFVDLATGRVSLQLLLLGVVSIAAALISDSDGVGSLKKDERPYGRCATGCP